MPTSKTRVSRIALFPANQDFYNPHDPDERIEWHKINTYSYLENIISAEIWAWEFLRRNQRYQRAVDLRAFPKNSDKPDEDQGAHEWGLRTLKHYQERFDEGDSPIWSAVQAKEVNLGISAEEQFSAASTIRNFNVLDGEACIILRFRDALGNKDFLCEQIERSKLQVLAHFEKINITNRPMDKFDNVAAKKLLTYLRIADAMNDPLLPSTAVIASFLLSESYLSRDRGTIGEQPMRLQTAINQQAHPASRIVYAHGYLRILLRKDLNTDINKKPPVKRIKAEVRYMPKFADRSSETSAQKDLSATAFLHPALMRTRSGVVQEPGGDESPAW